eukprot:378976-Prymnesium_polylepis.1
MDGSKPVMSRSTSNMATSRCANACTCTDDAYADYLHVGLHSVQTIEIEQVLQQHPAVLHCAAYGVPHESEGEVIKAVVVTSPLIDGKPVECVTRDLLEHCTKLLPEFKCPRIFEIVPFAEMPMTGSGKIAKAELRRGNDRSRRSELVGSIGRSLIDASAVSARSIGDPSLEVLYPAEIHAGVREDDVVGWGLPADLEAITNFTGIDKSKLSFLHIAEISAEVLVSQDKVRGETAPDAKKASGQSSEGPSYGDLLIAGWGEDRNAFEARHSVWKRIACVLIQLIVRLLNASIMFLLPVMLTIGLTKCTHFVHGPVPTAVLNGNLRQSARSDELGSVLAAALVGSSSGSLSVLEAFASVFFNLLANIVIAMLLCSVSSISWSITFKWLVAPSLSYEVRYSMWSLTWLQLQTVEDCIRMVHPLISHFDNSLLAVWYLRAVGAEVGVNVTLAVPPQICAAASLLTIEDDVLVEGRVFLELISTDDGMWYTCKHITLCAGTSVLQGAVVSGGAKLGAGSVACAVSLVQGIVPAHSLVHGAVVHRLSDVAASSVLRAASAEVVPRAPAGHHMELLAGQLVLVTLHHLLVAVVWSLTFTSAFVGPALGISTLPSAQQLAAGVAALGIASTLRLGFWLWYPLFVKWFVVGRKLPGTTLQLTTRRVLREWFGEL